MAMQLPRFSLATIGFMILLFAINFAFIRTAFGSAIPADWVAFAFLLLPMLDVISITLYRLRRRHRRTPSAIGFLVFGGAATVIVFVLCLIAPDTANRLIRTTNDAIVETSLSAFTWLFGNPEKHQFVTQFAVAFVLVILVPMALFCLPPFVVALLGAWLAPRLRSFRI
jgi:hypothetical protein